MTSRKANQARFVGVAAWLFRKRWVAGLLCLAHSVPRPGLKFPRAGSGGGSGSRGGGNFSPGSGGGSGHSRGSADNALESSGAFFQQLAGMQGQALQLPDRANVQQPLDRAGGGHFWWIHLSAYVRLPPRPRLPLWQTSRTVARKQRQPRSRRAKPMPRHASRRSSISAPLTAIAFPRQRKRFWPHSGRIPTSASALPPPGR